MSAVAVPMVASISRATPAQRAYQFKHRPTRLLRELALAAVEIRRRCGHRELGFSSLRDYVRARAGITWNTWSGFVRVGTVLNASLRASIHFDCGSLTFSVIERMASQCDPSRWDELADELEGLSTRQAFERLHQERRLRPPRVACSSSDELVRVSISMPASVAAYVEETLELASYLLGDEATPEQCMDAICSEATTEVLASVHPEQARERYQGSTRAVTHSVRSAPPALPSQPPTDPAGPTCPTASIGTSAQLDQPSVQELDANFVQLARQHAELTTQREDELLSMFHENIHGQCGFPRFVQFTEQCLGVSARTSHDMLRRARERRAGHPLALARVAGEISAFQFDELHRLERQAGVPRSSLRTWIDEAGQITTRRLSAKIEWAIRLSRTDYCSWSRMDFAPPADDDLRASIQSPTTIAANPSLPDFLLPAEDLFTSSESPTLDLVPLKWTLSRDVADALLQLMASISDRARLVCSRATGIPVEDIPHPPPWWALLKVVHIARMAWTHHVQPEYDRKWHRATLERDRYRCSAPECSKRSTLEVHHIVYASHGGPDVVTNLVTLCHYHHQHGEHGGRIRVRGTAVNGAQDLYWNMGIMGEWIGDRRNEGVKV